MVWLLLQLCVCGGIHLCGAFIAPEGDLDVDRRSFAIDLYVGKQAHSCGERVEPSHSEPLIACVCVRDTHMPPRQFAHTGSLLDQRTPNSRTGERV